MRRMSLAVVLCSLLFVAASPVLANSMEFLVFRGDVDNDAVANFFGLEMSVDHPDITGVQLITASATLDFSIDGPGEFYLDAKFPSLAALNAASNGTHTLRVTHLGGVTEYSATFNEVTEDMFPDIPVLDAVSPVIPQQYLFGWSWDGEADGMHIGASIDEAFELEDDSVEGSMDLGQTDYEVDFAPARGRGEFELAYGYLSDPFDGGNLVSDLEQISGDDLFDPSEDMVVSYIVSTSEAEFTVVPEPVSMALLGLGGAAVLLRRRRRA